MNPIKSTIRRGLYDVKQCYLPVFVLLGALIYTFQQSGWPLPSWVNNYVNDFLCMPIVLFVCRFAVRKLRSDRHLQLSLPLIFTVTLYYALYFEYYLPTVNLRYTADPFDVILYFSGSLYFYLMENKQSQLSRTNN